LPSSDEIWDPPSLEELVRRQGTEPIDDPEELAGVWPEDDLDDGFEEEFRKWRSHD
jgi:hypothetical protein